MMTRSILAIFISIFFICNGGIGCAHKPVYRVTEKLVLKPPLMLKPQAPLDDAVAGVPNFGLISRDVWRGGEPSKEGLQTLGTLGVKTIIDLREGDESAEVPQGVRYVRLPISMFRADQVDVGAVLKAILVSPKPVFIHCREGRDRTGLAIAAYRLWQGMSVSDATQELRNFHVNWWWDGPISARIEQLHRDGFPNRAIAPPRHGVG